MDSDHKSDWEASYGRRDNFLFYPHEEVIRFVSKYLRKRVGLTQFSDVVPDPASCRVLDLGCGIGRHIAFCAQMGLSPYGIDLAETAIATARQWLATLLEDVQDRIVQGDVRRLPWPDHHFGFALSHGVLDSMPYDVARAACKELARVMKPGGLFYCDLVSGDDGRHAREFAGEEVVTTAHEQGTIQLYFNFRRVQELFDGLFDIVECAHIRREEVMRGGRISRYHVVVRRS